MLANQIWLLLQITAAALGIAVWIALVARNVERTSQPALIVDIWGPLIIAAPILALLAVLGGSRSPRVDEVEALLLGGPILHGICCGALAGLIRAVDRAEHRRGEDLGSSLARPALFWAGTAAVLLLLAAAHQMTVWIGQVCFAIAAISLWYHMPEHAASTAGRASIDRLKPAATSANRGVAIGMIITILLVMIQCAAIVAAGDDEHALRWMMTTAIAFPALLLLSSILLGRSRSLMLRLCGWAAMYGLLFGLGVMSLMHMLPQAWNATFAADAFAEPPTVWVAYGFGPLAAEATLLLAFAGWAAAGQRMPGRHDRAAAAVLAGVSAVLLIQRFLQSGGAL